MRSPRVGIVAGAVIALLTQTVALGSPAVAATGAPTIRLTAGGLLYTATDPSAHETVFTATDTTVTIAEYGPAGFSRQVPAGCTVTDATDGGLVATCALAGRKVLQLRYGPGDDFIDASGIPARMSIDGSVGDGFNVAIGGLGPDLWVGGADDEALYGNSGSDVIRAGDGFNIVHGNSGADLITTGNGLDTIFGDASDDTILAGGDVDFAYGGGGNDTVTGGDGDDFLTGGSGNDLLIGLAGADELNGGSGADTTLGGAGDDLIRVRDGATDAVSCGTGQDTARVDAGSTDRVDGTCETVVRSDPNVVDPEDEFDIQDESVEEAVDAIDQHAGRPSGWHRTFWNLAFLLSRH